MMEIKKVKTRKSLGGSWIGIDVYLNGSTGKELVLTPFGVWKVYCRALKKQVYNSDTHGRVFKTLKEAKEFARKIVNDNLIKGAYKD